MKKLMACVLALLMMAAPVFGGAEEAALPAYGNTVLSDLVITMTSGEETLEIDLTGLSLAAEGFMQEESVAYLLSLIVPDGSTAAALALQADPETLLLAVDGISKALEIDLNELMEMAGAEMPADYQQQVESMISGEQMAEMMEQLEAFIAEFTGMIIVEEVTEPVEVDFMGEEMLPATGAVVTIPQEAVNYLMEQLELAAATVTEDVITDDLYEDDDDLEYTEPALESVVVGVWMAEDGSAYRVDITYALDDGTEVPVVGVAQIDAETGLIGFVCDINGELWIEGTVGVTDIGLYVSATATNAMEESTEIYFEIEQQMSEGSEVYDGAYVELSVGHEEETFVAAAYYSDNGTEEMLELSFVMNDESIYISYAGETAEGEAGETATSGTLYFELFDGVEEIGVSLNISTLENAVAEEMIDLTGMPKLTLADLETIDQDAEVMGEAMTVLGNAIAGLSQIPILEALISEAMQ